ncbi:RNA polymerase sigma factor [Breznakia pachnodae]|uniref:RNA polymerase sigma-70 factor (ECF subfamily) n=1 Tax=Breznakia pachnodae TaxID=265178 RepID=A0ABU0E465_9FIRM|nr:sigma-70 family RNA polymerase sigma factor [Breznakia pachnodae]MDQ0361506.1 RNA polymerase sigma-70 factor (ECF subfamily) [Breznakia pachnodae]
MNNSRKKIDIKHVEAFHKGDINSFTAIYDFYYDSVYYFALHFMRNKFDAEEIVQDTFIKVFECIDKLNNCNSFHCWLFKIAFNLIISTQRKRVKQVHLNDETNLEEIIEVADNQIEKLNRKEIKEVIKEEAKEMPIVMSKVGKMKYLNDYSIKEISNSLNIPEGTVKTNLFRYRNYVKPRLIKLGYDTFEL